MHSIRSAVLPLATLSLAAMATGSSALAQATKMDLYTLTNCGTYTTLKRQVHTKAWYAGNQLIRPDTNYTRNAIGAFATGKMTMRLSKNSGWPRLYFYQGGNMTAPTGPAAERSVQTSNGSWNTWSRQPDSVRMRVWDVPGRKVLLKLGYRCHTSGSGAGGHVAIDVGSNGWDVWSGPSNSYQTKNVLTTIPTSGVLEIKVELYGYAQSVTTANPFFSSWVNVDYAYPPRTNAVFTNYGSGCGPKLVGSSVDKALTHELSLTMSGAPVGAFGVLLLGSKRLNVAIPGTKCFLYTDAFLTLPFFTDLSGGATRKFPPLSRYEPLSFNAQDLLFLSGLRVATSNGVQITLKV